MAISVDSIREVERAVRQHGSIKAAARANGWAFGYAQRRMQAAKGLVAEAKPRVRVKALREASPFAALPADRPAHLYSDEVPVVPVSRSTIRVLAIGDMHDDPYLDKKRFRWIGKMAADLQPDHIVQIGDICDLESLSFHSPNDTDSGRFKPRFLADMESLTQALEAMFEPMARGNVRAQVDVTLGNHENRIWRFEDSSPEVSGMLQHDFTNRLTPYGIRPHRYGKFIHIGGVGFTHAPFSVMGKPIGGATASQTIARQAAHDVVSGHTHKKQVVTQPRIGIEEHITVIDLGCALPWSHVQSYAKHTLTGWWWGAWMLTIRDGHIQGHECIPMFELERRYS